MATPKIAQNILVLRLPELSASTALKMVAAAIVILSLALQTVWAQSREPLGKLIDLVQRKGNRAQLYNVICEAFGLPLRDGRCAVRQYAWQEDPAEPHPGRIHAFDVINPQQVLLVVHDERAGTLFLVGPNGMLLNVASEIIHSGKAPSLEPLARNQWDQMTPKLNEEIAYWQGQESTIAKTRMFRKCEPHMTDTPQYTPPDVWVWEKADSPNWRYSHTNRPIAGATHDKALPRGKHPLQLYSLATPNGVKVTIMLEELLAAGHRDAEYDAWLIRIGDGDQFGSGFVGVNPNSKIPALMDYGEQPPRRVFESGAILLYLADKFGAFLPQDRGKRTEALNWLFWQMGSTPYVGGGFGHFYAYAPVKIKYAIDRFTMEVKRQLDVLDRQLAGHRFIAGDDYTIADMAIWPWYGNGMLNGASYNDPRKFLQTSDYKNLTRWTKEIGERPAVKRGRMVNRASGPPEEQLHERHDASDIESKMGR